MRGREKADVWVCTSPYGFMSALLAAVSAVDLIKADVGALLEKRCGCCVEQLLRQHFTAYRNFER